MKTTLALDDDVLEAARRLASARKAPLGQVVSELVRKGLQPQTELAEEDGFPVFRVPPGAPPLTNEMVAHAAEH